MTDRSRNRDLDRCLTIAADRRHRDRATVGRVGRGRRAARRGRRRGLDAVAILVDVHAVGHLRLVVVDVRADVDRRRALVVLVALVLVALVVGIVVVALVVGLVVVTLRAVARGVVALVVVVLVLDAVVITVMTVIVIGAGLGHVDDDRQTSEQQRGDEHDEGVGGQFLALAGSHYTIPLSPLSGFVGFKLHFNSNALRVCASKPQQFGQMRPALSLQTKQTHVHCTFVCL